MKLTGNHTDHPYRLPERTRNVLIISLIGGGKSLALASRSVSSAGYSPRKGGRRLLFCLALCAVALLCSACHTQPTQTICGVPVQGSPWELAAAIHDHGSGEFVPECVELVTTTKAYISGYLLPDEQPATLICDLSDKGEVTAAVLHCETLNHPE